MNDWEDLRRDVLCDTPCEYFDGSVMCVNCSREEYLQCSCWGMVCEDILDRAMELAGVE